MIQAESNFNQNSDSQFITKWLKLSWIINQENLNHYFVFFISECPPFWLELDSRTRKFELKLTLNGVQIISIVNENPIVFNDVKVYTSDDYYPAADAQMRNLVINPDSGKYN